MILVDTGSLVGAANRTDTHHAASIAAPTAATRPLPSGSVPRLSVFYGVVITMYFSDHPPPHFHARYGEFQAQIEIDTGDVLDGFLPRRAAGMVQEWAELHTEELAANWERARSQEPLISIEPLP
jgi:hypothetical protein